MQPLVETQALAFRLVGCIHLNPASVLTDSIELRGTPA